MQSVVALVVCVALLDVVCCGRTMPFSATQNLTITPYDPSSGYYPDRIVNFDVLVNLDNGSYFTLGAEMLLRTYYSYSTHSNFKNYTIPASGVVYDGPAFIHKGFIISKVIDPCLVMINRNYEVTYLDAWTNAQQGTFKTSNYAPTLPSVLVGLTWDLTTFSCRNADGQLCTSYARWDVPTDKNYSKIYLKVLAYNYYWGSQEGNPRISDAIKSITFRQIGSKSCTLGLKPTTDEHYSFSIDFSTSHETKRTILITGIPQNASFMVTVVTIRNSSNTYVQLAMFPPTVEHDYYYADFSPPSYFIELYWTYIVSASISLLLLLSSSIAIIVLKYRQHRIQQREQYENIPDQHNVNNQHDNEQQSLIVSS